MIVRPRPSMFKLFFVMRGSIVPLIFSKIVVVAGLSALVVWAHRLWPGWLPGFSGTPFALLGLALSIFLSFRNSACYDRWWEARKLWGALMVAMRNLARQTLVLDEARRKRLLDLAIAYTQALVLHLRPGSEPAKVHARLAADDIAKYTASSNPPEALLQLMGAELSALLREQCIGEIGYQTVDRSLGEIAAMQAACERIRSTPIPFGYTLLLHRTAYLFCFLLPFSFADMLGWATPFIAALVAYTFFGLDALGDELEEPFGEQVNALPIGALADTIEINLREALGEKNLPPLPVPRDYLLM